MMLEAAMMRICSSIFYSLHVCRRSQMVHRYCLHAEISCLAMHNYPTPPHLHHPRQQQQQQHHRRQQQHI
jgi:hypothetical protein